MSNLVITSTGQHWDNGVSNLVITSTGQHWDNGVSNLVITSTGQHWDNGVSNLVITSIGQHWDKNCEEIMTFNYLSHMYFKIMKNSFKIHEITDLQINFIHECDVNKIS